MLWFPGGTASPALEVAVTDLLQDANTIELARGQ